jgi:hypothetical protein
VSVPTDHEEVNLPGRAERAAAMILIAIFVIALVLMAMVRNDHEWDRLIYLFGGLEALVFAAAGALFGTSVQRGNLADARKDASQARQEAESVRAQAQTHGSQAEKGRALAEACRAAADAIQGTSQRRGAREMDQFEPASPQLLTLVMLADRLFPDSRDRPSGRMSDPGPDLMGDRIG